MIGVFGTPPCAHENDTSRAVMASIQLQGYYTISFIFFTSIPNRTQSPSSLYVSLSSNTNE